MFRSATGTASHGSWPCRGRTRKRAGPPPTVSPELAARVRRRRTSRLRSRRGRSRMPRCRRRRRGRRRTGARAIRAGGVESPVMFDDPARSTTRCVRPRHSRRSRRSHRQPGARSAMADVGANSTSLDRIEVTGSRISRADTFSEGAPPTRGLRPRDAATPRAEQERCAPWRASAPISPTPRCGSTTSSRAGRIRSDRTRRARQPHALACGGLEQRRRRRLRDGAGHARSRPAGRSAPADAGAHLSRRFHAPCVERAPDRRPCVEGRSAHRRGAGWNSNRQQTTTLKLPATGAGELRHDDRTERRRHRHR